MAWNTQYKSYARIADVHPLPDLIEVQLDSFERFKKEGLRELFDELSPIKSFNGVISLHLPSYRDPISQQLG